MIPTEIREKAENVHRSLKSSRDANHLTDIIAEALMQERSRATAAERERCAKIAEDWEDSMQQGDLISDAFQIVAAAIRADTTQERTP